MFIKFVLLLKNKKYQVSSTVSNCKYDWQEKWLIFLFRVINDLCIANAVKLGSQRAKKREKRSRAIRMLYVLHDDTRIYRKTTMMYDTLLQKRATRRFFTITDSTRIIVSTSSIRLLEEFIFTNTNRNTQSLHFSYLLFPRRLRE